MSYPIEAEKPIIDALLDRQGWIKVSPTAIATAALTALTQAGWRLVYPDDFPGLCKRCKQPIAEGTRHTPFNGNQMFACSIVWDESRREPALTDLPDVDVSE